jgi:molecular chaperone DnaJ
MSVKQHPIFERDGKHLYCEVPITFADAALGGELEVPTLDGRVKLKIPAGDPDRQAVPPAWQGCSACARWWRGGPALSRGVETPVNLDKKQKDLLRELQESLGQGGHAHSPRQKSWFDGVKNFFDDMKP